MKKKSIRYGMTMFIIAVVGFFSSFGSTIYKSLQHGSEAAIMTNFFVIATLFLLSFLVFYLSHLVRLPSFVMAIFLGLAAKPLLVPIATSSEILGIVVGLGATLILFSGGLEIPFANFKKLIWKIFSVSFIGLFITAFLFSWMIWGLGLMFDLNISMMVSVLLGAVLASTDPAAIIPVLKNLRFRNRAVKDIIISESAVTDVVGTLLTIVFLSIALAGTQFANISQWYGAIFNYESGIILAKQLFFGSMLGIAGYLFLELLLRFKHFQGQEFEADSAFFISVPIIIFTIALFAGGSGYLAAFVAGLIFHISEHLTETERFFNNLVDGFLKPIIFILLGSLVDLPKLIEYAPIGIAAALIFMFIIRPIAVFVSMGAFTYWGKEKLSVRDLLFISFVRETGAIPAVLMLTIVSMGLPDVNGLIEIGMWTILLTLIVEPLLTPMVAEKLKVAEIMHDKKKVDLSEKSSVMLVTRGESFIGRLPFVADWANRHKIEKVVVMLCLEDKFTEDLETQIKAKAEKVFNELEQSMGKENTIIFKFVSRRGILDANIEEIAQTDNRISVIFVGKKMLDYRLNGIKQLSIPFYFMD